MKHQINCKEYNKKVCTDPKQCECNYSIRKEEPLFKEKMWHRFIYKFGRIDFGKFESEKWETHDILDFIESELQFERDDIVKRVLKLKEEWEPKYGYESDEEKGFQKGIISQIALKNTEIDDLLSFIQSRN